MPNTKNKEWPRYALMTITLLIGIVGILVSELLEIREEIKAFILHFSVALFIASFLGFTIDWWLKKQVAEDVFEASLGYLLPPELRDEVRWIYGNEFLCTSHNQKVKISSNLTQWVLVVVQTEREIKNISGGTATLVPSVGIDNWPNQPKQSVIHDLGYRIGGIQYTVPLSNVQTTAAGLSLVGSPIKLRSGESITMWHQTAEHRPIGADHHSNFHYPTIRPRVEVTATPPVVAEVTFATREKASKQMTPTASILEGVLLPHQSIRVKWW